MLFTRFHYMLYYDKGIESSSILVCFPSHFFPWLSNAWTHCVCNLFYIGSHLFLHIIYVYPKIFLSETWNVDFWKVIDCRETDSFSSKWLLSATVLALIAPLFLTIQAVIPLQQDILDVDLRIYIYV